MSDVLTELTARLAGAQARLAALEARERPEAQRGWRDDFLGRAIHEQYTIQLNGAGSAVGLIDGVHGGVAEITAGAAAGRYARLWLGDSAGGYDTLDADEGWVEYAYGRLMQTTDINWRFGAADSGIATDVLLAGFDTNISANWALFTRSGGGAWNEPASGVPADTSKHWHKLEVYPITGGREVRHYLDGALINTTTVEVPAAVITPIVYTLARAAAAKTFRIDFWAVIPMNLL